MQQIRVGVIGLGFMGRTHITAYREADLAGFDCPLTAVCDKSADRLSGKAETGGNIKTGGESEPLFDPENVRGYTDTADLFADTAVDLVSICTHTDTHVDLAIRALEAGKHVLVEKPLALTSDDARKVASAAAESDRICMPAMCIRFWPAYEWLKRAIESGEYGDLRSLTFHRLGSTPAWTDFYADADRSGGALVDLHIHDVDFIVACLGKPEAVASAGGLNHLTTLFRYPGVRHVVAEGGWAQDPGFGFKMRFVACFENATADFDLGRDPQLLICRGGESEPVTVDALSGYDAQIRHLLDCIRAGRKEADVTAADAVAALEVLEAERVSLETQATFGL